jgi:hypothetical protein
MKFVGLSDHGFILPAKALVKTRDGEMICGFSLKPAECYQPYLLN